MTNQKSPADARARAESAFAAAQQRDDSTKQEIAREREKVDAKTAKLRALRLEKEAADREAGVAPAAGVRARRIRTVKRAK